MLKNRFLWIILAASICVIFHSWFWKNGVSAGDLGYIAKIQYHWAHIYPFAWEFNLGNGFGGFTAPVLPVYIAMNAPEFFLGKLLGFSWDTIAKVSYLIPYLCIASFSMYALGKDYTKKSLLPIGILLYIANTYILMVLAGGQVLIALSYALAPLAISLFVKEKSFRLRHILFAGIILAVQMSIDIRIWTITLSAIILYGLCSISYKQFSTSFRCIAFFISSVVVSLVINSYWIVPTLFVHQDPFKKLGPAYNSIQAITFLSFAKFENALGLLHPNWPENVFGLTHFMRPEFLLLPILAFSSLLFIPSTKAYEKEKKVVLYFTFLGLVGIFLAKGTNDPFGIIYSWLFQHVPGFVMFRDATKWYVLVAISYSVLIPYTIGKIVDLLGEKRKIVQWVCVVTIGYLLFLIYPAIVGTIGGTFKQQHMPYEYTTLATYLDKQQQFSRILWVPTSQRYGYSSPLHPSVMGQDYFSVASSEAIIKILKAPETEKKLEEASIGYIIIPYDSQGEIFIKDRIYDNAQYTSTIQQIKKIPWLKEIPGFGKIIVFSLPTHTDHFWTPNKNMYVSYTRNSPTQFTVYVSGGHKGDVIIFSENFDKHWQATDNKSNIKIISKRYHTIYNSFILQQEGNQTLVISYMPQQWVIIGTCISIVSICVLFIGFLLHWW